MMLFLYLSKTPNALNCFVNAFSQRVYGFEHLLADTLKDYVAEENVECGPEQEDR